MPEVVVARNCVDLPTGQVTPSTANKGPPGLGALGTALPIAKFSLFLLKLEKQNYVYFCPNPFWKSVWGLQ